MDTDSRIMDIVIITHPSFIQSQSMPRFANMIKEGMKKKGHRVQSLTPSPIFIKLPAPFFLKKWLGYIDQFIVFPIIIKLKQFSNKTLFIFSDHALGPWVPLVSKRPHVIHCHDFLAQRSALGEIPENETSLTGRLYQLYIRKGYSKGLNFISVSKKTQKNLHSLLKTTPLYSDVIYNGLNQDFPLLDTDKARIFLENKIKINLKSGYILHVGGNQWYKNRVGVIEIYDAWRTQTKNALPLLMIGSKANQTLFRIHSKSPFKTDIHLLSDIDDETLKIAYAGASVFVFPSLAEGFGWPIAEAMASGCPVITTNEDPMSEVAGNAAFFIPRKPSNLSEAKLWAEKSANTLEKVINLTSTERDLVIKAGKENAMRFDPDITIDKIEEFYKKVLKSHKSS